MRWLAFGTYDVQAHPRVAVLLEGLSAHGEPVVEIVEPLGVSTAQRVAALDRPLRTPWRIPLLALRVAGRWAALTRRAAPRLVGGAPGPDVVLVGYLGHVDVLLARALVTLGRLRHPRRVSPVLVLDHLVSAAGTASDRDLAAAGGLTHRLLGALDRAAQAAADVVVVDTPQRLPELTATARERALVLPVGATCDWFAAGARRAGSTPGPLRVVFVGLFTPLQGTATIARALALLAERTARGELEVTLVGQGQDYRQAREIASGTTGLTWLDWVPAAELPALVSRHHVGLGIFGTTPKALSVVPTKVFQAAAAGCAVVTSDTVPQRDSLADAAVFVPAGDAEALAAALARLAADRPEVDRLRTAAFERASDRHTAYAVVTPLVHQLHADDRTDPT